MAALASSSTWIPEDDLLLKNAVESGASLEALAKGAVQFSRRFSFQELQSRWHSLLYDRDIAAQASASMRELERSGFNPSTKMSISDKANDTKMVHGKRKAGSIRKQYYAMRKRLRNEFFSSTDLGFLGETNLHNGCGNGGHFHEHVTLDNGPPVGNFMLEDCMPDHFGLQEEDFDILHNAFPQAMTDVAATNGVSNIIDVFHSEGPESLAVADNHVSTIARDNCLHGFPDDISSLAVQDSLRNDGAESFPQRIVLKEIPHCLEDNLISHATCSVVEEIGSSQPLTGTKLLETDGSETKPMPTFDSPKDNHQNICSEFGGKQHFNTPNSDDTASFHTMGFSPLPNVPLWKTMEDISPPSMPVSVSPTEKRQEAEDVSALPDKDDSKSSTGHGVVHVGPLSTDRRNGDGFTNSSALSDGEFADLSDSLLDFSNEEEILLRDMDRKDTIDKSSCGNSLHFGSPMDTNEGDACKVEPERKIVSQIGLATASSACPAASEVLASDLHSDHGDYQSVSRPRIILPSTSVSNSKPPELGHGHIYCPLNTEDPEIPCNDDIFLLIHPAASFTTSATKSITVNVMEPISSTREKDKGQRLNLIKKVEDLSQSFMPSQNIGPYMLPSNGPGDSLAGYSVKSELPDTSSLSLSARHAKKAVGDPTQGRSIQTTLKSSVDGQLENIVTKVELRAINSSGTFGQMPVHAEAGSVDITLPESVVNPSTSDHEEPESDNDVPYFSDIEAMILEMDLTSYDQDSYFSRRVSNYQHEDSKRKIVRLEQCAQSSLQRAMASQGALAILYGRRSKHFIRKTEVILGRSTEETDVDIDLGKEGRASKISRRQATIKMEGDGSFILKNFGKAPILVNGKTVVTGQSLGLSSSCLIEIRGMNFVFEMNHKSVRRHLDNISRRSQQTKFEWLPARDP